VKIIKTLIGVVTPEKEYWTINLKRKLDATRSQVINHVPEFLLADISTWMMDRGICWEGFDKFPAINMCSGDTIEFKISVKFYTKRDAMLFKLSFA
jgi:hypothetical protein